MLVFYEIPLMRTPPTQPCPDPLFLLLSPPSARPGTSLPHTGCVQIWWPGFCSGWRLPLVGVSIFLGGSRFSFLWPCSVVAGLMHLSISQSLIDFRSPNWVEEVICRLFAICLVLLGKRRIVDSLRSSHILNLWKFPDCCGIDEGPP